jgi:hypothetical protein
MLGEKQQINLSPRQTHENYVTSDLDSKHKNRAIRTVLGEKQLINLSALQTHENSIISDSDSRHKNRAMMKEAPVDQRKEIAGNVRIGQKPSPPQNQATIEPEWSKHIKKSNTNKQIKISTERLEKLHAGRKLMLDKKYKKIEEDAEKEFEVYKNNPLFMAGLMLYAGEGDKTSRNLTRLSNSEFYLHLVFIRFSQQFLNIQENNIKFWLLLYPDHNIENCIDIWSKKTGIKKTNFYKSQVIIGKEKTKKLQYGVGNSIISSTSLKKKMMKWLELCKLHFK